MKESVETIPHFQSATAQYLRDSNVEFNPIYVATQSEWNNMVYNLMKKTSLNVKTLILPPGVTLSDKRLANAKVKRCETYKKCENDFFEFPATCYTAQIKESLIDSSLDSTKDARYQVSIFFLFFFFQVTCFY
jgi:hypothetical protein